MAIQHRLGACRSLGGDLMGLHKFRSRAIRFNGFTDGIVVPTGQYRERGVDLLGPAYTGALGGTTIANSLYSNATKIGRLHYPSSGNVLNTLGGQFTVEAFFVPDYGGVLLEKPGAFILRAGQPFSSGKVMFGLETDNGFLAAETSFDLPVLMEDHSGTYSGGEHKPQELTLGAQGLMHVSGQFTGNELLLFLNGELAASVNLVEDTAAQNRSSDLFIGGRGGEFRGMIESVRISRGLVAPVLEAFTLQDATVGLWDFNDEIPSMDLRFFGNAHEASPSQGRDGPGDSDGRIDSGVIIGYDFRNSGSEGRFRIRDPPQPVGVDDHFTGLEMLGGYITGLHPFEVRKKWAGSTLTVGTSKGFTQSSEGYITDTVLPMTTLNAVINQSGTHPITGLSSTPDSKVFDPSSGSIIGLGSSDDLDPMENPIERVRITKLDFANDEVVCLSVHVKSPSALTNHNHPEDQGMLFAHADGTPVWLTYGNSDLIIDPGEKDSTASGVSRQKDAFTRALFTQGQRFMDSGPHHNTAYFVSSRSRITTGTAAPTTSVPDPDPPKTSLLMWLSADAINTGTDVSGGYLTQWRDNTTNNFGVYPVGASSWVVEESSALFNNHRCIKQAKVGGSMLINGNDTGSVSEELTHSADPSFTIFMLVNPVWDSSHGVPLFGRSSSVYLHGNATGGSYTFKGSSTTTLTPVATASQTVLISVVVDRTSTNTFVYHHGELAVTFSASVTSAFTLSGGLFGLFGQAVSFNAGTPTSSTGSNLAPENFRVAEVLLYEKAMTEAERSVVHGYFLDKYGVI